MYHNLTTELKQDPEADAKMSARVLLDVLKGCYYYYFLLVWLDMAKRRLC